MASASESSILVDAIEKMLSIPSIDEENSNSYVVKSCGMESVVNGVSSLEAATKVGFLLLSLNLMSSLKNTVEVFDVATRRKFFYNVFEGTATSSHKVIVELDKMEMEKIPEEYETQTLESEIDRQSTCLSSTAIEKGVKDDLITQCLNQFFGFPSFRLLQRETILSVLDGRSVLTIVGTGGGKTLMYMLPAVLSTKPTLVLSPIKSLIDDLLLRSSELNIKACKFTGELSQELRDEQLQRFHEFKLVFCTPEVLEEGNLLEKVKQPDAIERIVFDEAHTIVTWGGTFRPVYKEVCCKLGEMPCPKLLLSATVPLKVQLALKDIVGQVHVYSNSVFRDNLILEVVERGPKMYDDLASFISKRKEQCGIIYCVLPHDVAKVHAELLKRDIVAVKYHGQLSEEVKTTSHSKWMSGEVKVIVANSSFGMGIDKADVRFVLHARIPTSVDEYFQQCGRGGRDGIPATCRLYYSCSDKSVIYKLFDKQQEVFQTQCSQLNDLINILENPVHCRHKEIMAYFGEVRDNFACQTGCDNCKTLGAFHITDGTSEALKVIQAVVELTGKNITCNALKLFLAGSKQKSILVSGLDEFANFGILGKTFVPIVMLEKFLHLLILNDILAEKVQKKGNSFSIFVTLGPKAHDLLALNISVIKYSKAK